LKRGQKRGRTIGHFVKDSPKLLNLISYADVLLSGPVLTPFAVPLELDIKYLVWYNGYFIFHYEELCLLLARCLLTLDRLG